MKDSSQSGEAQRGFQEADTLLESAQLLGKRVHAYVDLLVSDSLDALRTTESPFANTWAEEGWPLSETSVLYGVLLKKAQEKLEHPDGRPDALPPEEDKDVIAIRETKLSSYKYGNGYLQEHYGRGLNQYAGHARDLASWAEAMSQRGWPLVVHMDLNDGRRGVKVSVYKDTDEIRDFLGRSGADEEEDSAHSKLWMSERVVATSYGDELERVKKLLTD